MEIMYFIILTLLTVTKKKDFFLLVVLFEIMLDIIKKGYVDKLNGFLIPVMDFMLYDKETQIY